MIKEGKFGSEEAVSLLTITMAAKTFFTSPRALVELTGTAAWYTTLISNLVAMVGFIFIYLLLKRFPGRDIIGAFEESLGRYLGFLISALLSVFLIFIALTMLREFTEVLKTYVMPLSPPSYIISIFLTVSVILLYQGLEGLARLARLSIFILLATAALVFGLSAQNYNVYHLFPLLGYGLDKTLMIGALRSSAYGEIIILGIIATSLQGVKHVKRVGILSLVFSGLFISANILIFLLVFPYYTAMEITSPMYQMTSIISYGRLLERLDPFFLLIWTFSTFIAVTTMVYSGMSVYCKMFRIKDYRPTIIPFAIVVFFGALIPPDITTVLNYVEILRKYGWALFFAPSAIALLVAVVRGKQGREQNA